MITFASAIAWCIVLLSSVHGSQENVRKASGNKPSLAQASSVSPFASLSLSSLAPPTLLYMPQWIGHATNNSTTYSSKLALLDSITSAHLLPESSRAVDSGGSSLPTASFTSFKPNSPADLYSLRLAHFHKRHPDKLMLLHSSQPAPDSHLQAELNQLQQSTVHDSPPQPYHDISLTETTTSVSPLLEADNTTSDPSLSEPDTCIHLMLNLCNLRYSLSWTIVLFVAYFIVFFIGLLGNLSVLWIVYMLKGEGKRRHSCVTSAVTNYYAASGNGLGTGHSSQNSSYYCQHHYSTVPMITINRSNVVFYRFVCNLALADLLVVLFCLPSTFIGNIYLPWVLGRLVCKAVPYLQGVSVSASVYTLVAISIDRFYAIYYPLSKKCSTALCWCTILLIWTWSFAISFPWLVYFEVIPVDGNDYLDHAQTFQVCRDIWPSAEMEKAHFLVVNLGLQYLIPLSVIALFYILILKKIAKRKLPKLARHMPATLKDGNRQSSLVIERSKVKVFKMLIVLVLLFALSWLPLYIIFFFIKLGPRLDDRSITSRILDTSVPVAQWLGASNSAANPILYFFFNAKFRSYYRNSWLKTFSCLSVIRPSVSSRDDKSTATVTAV